MIGEGLTMYLTETDGIALLRRIVDTLPVRRVAVRRVQPAGHQVAVDERGGAPFRSNAALGDQRTRRDRRGGAGRAAAGLGVAVRLGVFTDVAWYYRAMATVMSLVPSLRYMAQYHRYAF